MNINDKCPECGAQMELHYLMKLSPSLPGRKNQNKAVMLCSKCNYVEYADVASGKEYSLGERWNYFLSNQDEVISTVASLKKFMSSVDSIDMKSASNTDRTLLKAIVNMQYLRLTDKTNKTIFESVCDIVKKEINKGTRLIDYYLINNILSLILLDPNDESILTKCKYIDGKIISFDVISSYRSSYLENCYIVTYENILLHVLDSLVRSGEEKKFRDCLELIGRHRTNKNIIISNMLLSSYYGNPNSDSYRIETEDKARQQMAFAYANNAYENVADFIYDSSLPYHKEWLKAIERLIFCYKEGIGVNKNYKMVYNLSKLIHEYGDPFGTFSLAECNEKALGTDRNATKALEYYLEAKDRGFEHDDLDIRIDNLTESVSWSGKKPSPQKSKASKRAKTKVKGNTEHDVFISYSRKDTKSVEYFVEGIENEGYNVWIDKLDIESGDQYKRVIVDAIKNSQVMIFFSSESANNSEWTSKEIGIAVKNKKAIIPVRLDNSEYDKSVELDLVNFDYIDCFDDSMMESARNRLLRALDSKVEREEQIELEYDEPDVDTGYLELCKAAIVGSGIVTSTSRKMLDVAAGFLGLPAERAIELEASAGIISLSEEEASYLEAYIDAAGDGHLTKGSRKVLDNFIKSSGISKERANEIEKMAIHLI